MFALVSFAFSKAVPADNSQPTPPVLIFGADVVSVTGLTPGTDVYLFSVSREPKGYYNDIVQREAILHDVQKSGRVEYPIGQAVPTRSIWFVVDLTSGLAAAGAPEGYHPQSLNLDANRLKKDSDGDFAKLSFEGALVDAILVRPGVGIWGGTIGLRAGKDEGSDDGRNVTVSALKLDPRAGTSVAAPSKLRNKDVVFLMNSYTGAYSFGTIGGGR